jgi:hypothetical protein
MATMIPPIAAPGQTPLRVVLAVARRRRRSRVPPRLVAGLAVLGLLIAVRRVPS